MRRFKVGTKDEEQGAEHPRQEWEKNDERVKTFWSAIRKRCSSTPEQGSQILRSGSHEDENALARSGNENAVTRNGNATISIQCSDVKKDTEQDSSRTHQKFGRLSTFFGRCWLSFCYCCFRKRKKKKNLRCK